MSGRDPLQKQKVVRGHNHGDKSARQGLPRLALECKQLQVQTGASCGDPGAGLLKACSSRRVLTSAAADRHAEPEESGQAARRQWRGPGRVRVARARSESVHPAEHAAQPLYAHVGRQRGGGACSAVTTLQLAAEKKRWRQSCRQRPSCRRKRACFQIQMRALLA